MLACKKHKNIPGDCKSLHIFVFILIFLLPHISIGGTNNINVISADGVINEDMYNVNAYISYQLGNESRNALEHGIPLEFDIVIRLKKPRLWLWDKTLVSRTITYRLEHQPLSGDYLVTRLNDGELEQFQKLDDVLRYIGEIKNFPLADAAMLKSGSNLYAQVKSHLNIEALPAPLRQLAYLSSEWRLSSPWQSWLVTE